MSDKHKKKKKFINKPTFPGGTPALNAFIEKNLQYPQEALQNGVQGSVHVKYDVDEEGNVLKAEVLRGIGSGCDEEALRLVKLLRFQAVRNKGQHIVSHFDIIIRFKLNTLQAPTGSRLQYVFIASEEPTYIAFSLPIAFPIYTFSTTPLN